MKFHRGAKQEPDKSIFSKQLLPKKSFSGFTPNLFIGSHGYPFINVGALSSEDKQSIDTPKDFLHSKVQDVVTNRQQFVNSRLVMKAQSISGRFIEQLQDVAKSSRQLDSEVDLAKPLPSMLSLSQRAMPHGPSATLKKLSLTSNAKVQRKVESITSDTDVKAVDAIAELGQAKVDEHHMTKLLSAGTLGQKRKLVPTKWSITAVDDMRGKQLLEHIRSAEDVHPHLRQASLMGNTFYLLFLPGSWSFELLEITFPGTIYNSSDSFLFSHDYEYAQGRKKYVQETAGAYYAARLAVLEYLQHLNKQGRVICLRSITPAYAAPLGVWIIREGVRKALQAKETEVESAKESILQFGKQEGIDGYTILGEVQLLREQQARLTSFLRPTS